MSFQGRYGDLPTLECARAVLMDIEKSLTPEEWAYMNKDNYEPCVEAFQLNRLYFMIMGCQQVVMRNNGDLGFSRLPRLWWPNGRPSEKS